MTELFFGPQTIWFGLPAVLGTTFFLLRTAMMLVGGDLDGDASLDVDVGDVDAGDLGDGGESTDAFKILSIQAISAFLAGFGWGGLGALRGSGWSMTTSVIVATVFGLAIAWFLGWALKLVYGFQSEGTVPMYHALHSEGSVYAQIPASGTGKGQVRVVIGDREKYYTATTEGEAIPTGAKIRVVEVNDEDNSVTVTEA